MSKPATRTLPPCPCGASVLVYENAHFRCRHCGRVTESCCEGHCAVLDGEGRGLALDPSGRAR